MAENETATAPRKLIINGVEFSAVAPYAEGHVLTANEARHLNQTYFENLRNNFSKTVKASLEGAEGAVPQDQLPAKFAEYVGTYTLDSDRSAGTGAKTLDPIEKEARVIARELVKVALEKQGRKLTPPKEASDEEKADYKAKIDAKIEQLAQREEILAEARANIAKRGKTIDKLTAQLDL